MRFFKRKEQVWPKDKPISARVEELDKMYQAGRPPPLLTGEEKQNLRDMGIDSDKPLPPMYGTIPLNIGIMGTSTPEERFSIDELMRFLQNYSAGLQLSDDVVRTIVGQYLRYCRYNLREWLKDNPDEDTQDGE